jgi:hypothetical protein
MRRDWIARISRYFAFCVDGGWSSPHLTLRKLTQVLQLAHKHRALVVG